MWGRSGNLNTRTCACPICKLHQKLNSLHALAIRHCYCVYAEVQHPAANIYVENDPIKKIISNRAGYSLTQEKKLNLLHVVTAPFSSTCSAFKYFSVTMALYDSIRCVYVCEPIIRTCFSHRKHIIIISSSLSVSLYIHYTPISYACASKFKWSKYTRN